MGGPCQSFMENSAIIGRSTDLGVVLGFLQLVFILLIILYQWRNQLQVRRGYRNAASNLIVPAYLWIFGTYLIAGLWMVGVGLGVDSVSLNAGEADYIDAVFASLAWGFYNMVLIGTAFFLCQTGAGLRALYTASRYGCIAGVVIAAMQFCTYTAQRWAPGSEDEIALGLMGAYEGLLFLFYIALVLLPQRFLYRRSAGIVYAWFWVITLPFQITSSVLMYLQVDAGYCFYIAFPLFIFGITRPWVLYYVLRKDSQYWQGGWAEVANDRDVRSPLLGVAMSAAPALALSEQLDEVPARRYIHYAEIELDNGKNFAGQTSLLGAGGTARVFSGRYNGHAVAIKMLFCVEFTEEIISNYTRESHIMYNLRHPNIVHLFGLCVVPPVISLVMERCTGNLSELLQRSRINEIDPETMLFFAIDCASAVSYLHQLSPPIIHMDLKSNNFLVGEYRVPRYQRKEGGVIVGEWREDE
jgi:hypothetical protein